MITVFAFDSGCVSRVMILTGFGGLKSEPNVVVFPLAPPQRCAFLRKHPVLKGRQKGMRAICGEYVWKTVVIDSLSNQGKMFHDLKKKDPST